MPLPRRHPCQSSYEGSQKRLSAESEQLLAQSDDLFDVGGSLAGLVMRSAEKPEEAARPLLLKTAHPLAHGEDGSLKPTSGRA
jgi:hypothetical protein